MTANTMMTPTIRQPGYKLAKGIGRTALYAVSIGCSVCFMFPLFWSAASALKAPSEWFAFPPPLLPSVPQWSNFPMVFQIAPFSQWILNTLYVTTLNTVGTIISASFAGYAFARFDFRGKDLLFLATLGTMMIPAQVTLIPQYLLFWLMGWLNTFKPLWIPAWFGGGAFFIFLMRQFIMSLPKDLDEAAFIDGASYFRIFLQIILPLCRPVLATATIISFIGSWNDFVGPLIYLDQRDKFTMALGLSALKTTEAAGSSGAPRTHYLMAASVMSILPIVILFFAAQRYFVRGIVMSGIKG